MVPYLYFFYENENNKFFRAKKEKTRTKKQGFYQPSKEIWREFEKINNSPQGILSGRGVKFRYCYDAKRKNLYIYG